MDLFMFVALVFIVLVVVGVLLLIAVTRKGSVATVTMTKRRIVLHSAAPPDVVYASVVQHCPAGYSVEDADPDRGLAILASRPTAFTWGFFYPAVVSAEGSGTRVDLGIKSKLFQAGPLVTRAHRTLAHSLASVTHSRIEDD